MNTTQCEEQLYLLHTRIYVLYTYVCMHFICTCGFYLCELQQNGKNLGVSCFIMVSIFRGTQRAHNTHTHSRTSTYLYMVALHIHIYIICMHILYVCIYYSIYRYPYINEKPFITITLHSLFFQSRETCFLHYSCTSIKINTFFLFLTNCLFTINIINYYNFPK